MNESPALSLTQNGTHVTITLAGSWCAHDLKEITPLIDDLTYTSDQTYLIDGQKLLTVDTAGAWLILRVQKAIQTCGAQASTTFSKETNAILNQVASYPIQKRSPEEDRLTHVQKLLAHIGDRSLTSFETVLAFLSFLGDVALSMLTLFRNPRRFRMISFLNHIERDGLFALPIVGLISFLIGIVLVYQGVEQLRRFGAEIFTVDLLAISLLREIGILLTAIVIAGRSGSAFTAQIGVMKLNQEIDALFVLGLNPLEILVIPRILALIIALPLLSFFSDMMGLLGGAVMSYFTMELTLADFLHQLQLSIKPWTFWIGMIKAPFFAAVIALIGCFEGMRVRGGADSVGAQTTKSVVESIFLVIVLDAFFSILFSMLRI